MKIHKIIKILIILVLTFCLIIGMKIYVKSNEYLTMKNGVLSSSELPTDSFKSNYNPKILFANMKVTEVKSFTFDILENKNITDIPVLLKAQRYYIPINYIAKFLGYSSTNQDNSLLLKNSSDNIILQQTKYKNGSIKGDLRGNLIKRDNEFYISISDIEQVFKLTALFNFEENRITLLHSNNEIQKPQKATEPSNVALIRLEDFTAGWCYLSAENQTKFKCMSDLMYSNGVKYHITWIPRFKDPSNKIDNNLLSEDSITNVGFVNLLDYLINHNASIGLHGYTHQSGDSTSGAGIELSDTINSSTEDTRGVIENSIDLCSALNIKYDFFESPHYAENATQKNILEDYFQYIYEPFDVNNDNNIYKHGNHLYMPTPLGYVENNDVSKIIDGISSSEEDILASFFYHPYLEYDYINFNTTNDKLNVSYDTNSPLSQIIKALNESNCKTIHIDELKQNTTS